MTDLRKPAPGQPVLVSEPTHPLSKSSTEGSLVSQEAFDDSTLPGPPSEVGTQSRQGGSYSIGGNGTSSLSESNISGSSGFSESSDQCSDDGAGSLSVIGKLDFDKKPSVGFSEPGAKKTEQDSVTPVEFVRMFMTSILANKPKASQRKQRKFKGEEKRERKRKINRLSAHRKRAREKYEIETLSEGYKKLTAVNEALKADNQKLLELFDKIKTTHQQQTDAAVVPSQDSIQKLLMELIVVNKALSSLKPKPSNQSSMDTGLAQFSGNPYSSGSQVSGMDSVASLQSRLTQVLADQGVHTGLASLPAASTQQWNEQASIPGFTPLLNKQSLPDSSSPANNMLQQHTSSDSACAMAQLIQQLLLQQQMPSIAESTAAPGLNELVRLLQHQAAGTQQPSVASSFFIQPPQQSMFAPPLPVTSPRPCEYIPVNSILSALKTLLSAKTHHGV